MSSVKEHEVSEGLQAARWGFSLGMETSSSPPGGHQDSWGHALSMLSFITIFPPSSAASWKCLMLLDFWSFSKIAGGSVLFLSWSFLTLFVFIFFSLSLPSIFQKAWLRRRGELRANAAWVPVLPLAGAVTCLVSVRHKAVVPSHQIMGLTHRGEFLHCECFLTCKTWVKKMSHSYQPPFHLENV